MNNVILLKGADRRKCISAVVFVVLLYSFLGGVCGASAHTEVEEPFLKLHTEILQYQKQGHMLGFGANRLYIAGKGYALIEEFVGGSPQRPLAPEAGSASVMQKFNSVRYKNVWPGITIRYSAISRGLAESTFILEAGADPEKIKLHYNLPGHISDNGSLIFRSTSGMGWFSQSAPIAWQEIAGKKVSVAVEFVSLGDNCFGYRLGAYEGDSPLFIDPVYQWHTFYGGSASDYANSIALDQNGNIYISGYSDAAWDVGMSVPLHEHSGGQIYLYSSLMRAVPINGIPFMALPMGTILQVLPSIQLVFMCQVLHIWVGMA